MCYGILIIQNLRDIILYEVFCPEFPVLYVFIVITDVIFALYFFVSEISIKLLGKLLHLFLELSNDGVEFFFQLRNFCN